VSYVPAARAHAGGDFRGAELPPVGPGDGEVAAAVRTGRVSATAVVRGHAAVVGLGSTNIGGGDQLGDRVDTKQAGQIGIQYGGPG
jgi:hypothetical protein